MTVTPNLRLPFILAQQAQKHVTHNEGLNLLDAIVQLSVLDRDLSSPPDAPPDGARYIAGPSATGAWSGKSGNIAVFVDGAWMFLAPMEGWTAWIADEDDLVVWTGSAWVSVRNPMGVITSLGINATASTINRLSLNSAASLFNHDGAGHQLKINKAASANVSSLLFQTDFAGRAELGLSGDDDFRIKVSTDGTSWKEVLGVDRESGAVRLPYTAAATAPNFLINGDFTINQRGFSGGALAANAFGFDRWKADNGGANLTISSQVVTLAIGAISQVVEPALWGAVNFASTQFTISVDIASADLIVSLGSASGTITAGPGRRSVTLTTSSSDTGNLAFKVSKASAGTVSFGRIKVEAGASASAFVARSRAEELRLCQRYFQSYKRTGVNGLQSFFLASMWGSGTSWGFVGNFNLNAPMRAAPTIGIGAMSTYTIGTPGVFGATPTSLAIYDAYTLSSGGPQQLVIYGTSASGIVGTCFFSAAANTTATLDFSAEL